MIRTPPVRSLPVPPVRSPLPGRRPRIVASGWIPAGLLTAMASVVLCDSGVAPWEVTAFAAYVVLAIAVPGTLLWRFLSGRSGHVAGDVAAGTALGYAAEVLTYIPARWTGVPRLFVAWPVITVAAFLLVPRLRRCWRGSGLHAPAWWSWTMSALIGLVALASSAWVRRTHGPTWPSNANPDPHMTFNLALIGELKHHMPPVIPWVRGEPLHYHWFVYADMAATDLASGVRPQVLLYRLSMLPMIAVFAVLLGAVALALTAKWWVAIVALLLNYVIVPPSPATWTAQLDVGLLAQAGNTFWISPSQTFGAMLFAAVVLALVEFLSGRTGGPRFWLLLTVLLVAVMGAKATYLPLLFAGLALGWVAGLLRRRPDHRTLMLTVLTGGLIAFAHLVLFGGASQGLSIDPGGAVRLLAGATAPGLRPDGLLQPVSALVALMLGWGCAWAGIAGLYRRRSGLTDPVPLMLLGIGGAGIGALIVFCHPGLSQFYFPRCGNPYLAVCAAWGLAAALPARPARTQAPALAGVVAIGYILAVAFRLLSDHAPFPLLIVATSATGLAVLWFAERFIRPSLSRASLIVVLFTALTLPPSLERLQGLVLTAAPAAAATESTTVRVPGVSEGTYEAGRWLRRHSDPDDLVATNAHCLVPGPVCPNRHFVISAATERRMLVEGWGYTESNNARAKQGGDGIVPFWNPRLLAENDAAFTAPSAVTIGRLKDHYGVRWLFADARSGRVSPALGDFATLRHRRGTCSVYELRDRPGRTSIVQ